MTNPHILSIWPVLTYSLVFFLLIPSHYVTRKYEEHAKRADLTEKKKESLLRALRFSQLLTLPTIIWTGGLSIPGVYGRIYGEQTISDGFASMYFMCVTLSSMYMFNEVRRAHGLLARAC